MIDSLNSLQSKNNIISSDQIQFKVYQISDWIEIINSNDISHINRYELKCNLSRGIPECIRGDVWAFLSKANKYIERSDQFTYFRLFSQDNLEIELQIRKDIHRTFPEHEMFAFEDGYGQQGLLNILKAYSQFDSEIGYCQGMGFIAGILLMYMHSEELAFWGFVGLMDKKNWRRIYEIHTPGLLELIKKLSSRIQTELPMIFKHFHNEGVDFTVFSRYFITICSYRVPIKFAVRIMDVFLLEGEDELIKIIAKMLELKQKRILRLKQEALYSYINENLVTECYEEFEMLLIL
ncbi:unnamed protein product [Blepharisma stoltei]|uniref:Rab-GAP TBC domain-containing protein n=1 Tax=Blepharisma stoltei TaxID=1481888 RepID=A0AAU9K8G5_9CILI|nr:unnamed protein product [Blepharisma stoltei]